MRRDVLLLTEMIDAADQAGRLADGITTADLEQGQLSGRPVAAARTAAKPGRARLLVD
jgi:hypothetical protein